MVETAKIQSQMRKGLLDFVLLAALKKHARYPREMIEDFKQSGLGIVEGTLYPLLLRLSRQGLVSYEWREASGHPRKYYALTKKGKEVLRIYEQEWEHIKKLITSVTT